jgi:hypothetical protein
MSLATSKRKKQPQQQHKDVASSSASPKKAVRIGSKVRKAGADDHSAAKLYKRAKALLSAPSLSPQALRELHEIQAQVAAIPPSHLKFKLSYAPYPSAKDPNIQQLIASKKEFAQHKQEKVEITSKSAEGVERMWTDTCSPRAFKLTPSQLFLKTFMAPGTPYNSLLLFHGVGVGKTCSAITIAEGFKDRKTLVLVNPALQNNFRKEIFDSHSLKLDANGRLDTSAMQNCTGTAYLDRIENKELMSIESIERRVARFIAAKYTFMGPRQFANYVMRLGEGPSGLERIRSKFSDMLIIVDEAHHLRTHGPLPQRRPGGVPPSPSPSSNIDDMMKNNTNNNSSNSGEKLVTPALRRVLKHADGVKLLLMTATPMFNDARDIIELLNLMLLNDKRAPIRASEVFDREGRLIVPSGRALLEEASRGYVSYMRGDNPFSFPIRLGPSASRDRGVLRKADMPRLDIRGQQIASEDAIRNLEICGAPMSAYQAKVYQAFEDDFITTLEVKSSSSSSAEASITDKDKNKKENKNKKNKGDNKKSDRGLAIDDEDTDDEDEVAEDESDAKKRPKVLYAGLQICNVVFPTASSPGAPKYGIDAFWNCFDRVSAKPLQLRYKGSAPHAFLTPGPKALGTYAPKMQAILERIMSSKGIVFVYSRWIWMGLLPLAMALEHAGFKRYNARPILQEQHPNQNQDRRHHQLSYSILCGMPEITSDDDGDIRAARSPENADGSIIKVILASEFATEGISLRNVREVHIMDPWYHLNKMEQIVGRASRFCTSHASLPLAERNVTVYLHASYQLGPGGPARTRETIDLRAYRIAEAKYSKIKEVEGLLIANAVDCPLNVSRLYYDKAELDTRITITTSQGVTHAAYTIGDDVTTRGAKPRCLAWKKDDEDTTTYSPDLHAFDVDSYVDAVRGVFAGRTHARLDEVEAAVRPGVGARSFSKERLLLALDAMLKNKVEVSHKTERGFLVYRSNLYLFQPLGSRLPEALTLEERADANQRLPTGFAVRFKPPATSVMLQSSIRKQRRVSGRPANSGESSSAASSSPSSSSSSSVQRAFASRMPARWDSGNVLEAVEKRLMQVSVRAPANPVVLASYRQQLVDCVVDRMKTSELLDTCGYALQQQQHQHKHKRQHKHHQHQEKRDVQHRQNMLLKSLTSAGILMRGGSAAHVFDPNTRAFFSSSDQGKAWAPSEALDLQEATRMFRAQHARLKQDVRSYAGFIALKPGVGPMFKIIGPSDGSEGCVCHQTSTVTVADMTARIRRLDKDLFDATRRSDKRSLCELYELALRKNATDAFARPAQYIQVVASQKRT